MPANSKRSHSSRPHSTYISHFIFAFVGEISQLFDLINYAYFGKLSNQVLLRKATSSE